MAGGKANEITLGGQGMYNLFLLFLVLKLTNAISWSWWWVTAPLWGPAAAFVVVVALLGAVAGFNALFKSGVWRRW